MHHCLAVVVVSATKRIQHRKGDCREVAQPSIYPSQVSVDSESYAQRTSSREPAPLIFARTFVACRCRLGCAESIGVLSFVELVFPTTTNSPLPRLPTPQRRRRRQRRAAGEKNTDDDTTTRKETARIDRHASTHCCSARTKAQTDAPSHGKQAHARTSARPHVPNAGPRTHARTHAPTHSQTAQMAASIIAHASSSLLPSSWSPFRRRENNTTTTTTNDMSSQQQQLPRILIPGGAGYIGSHVVLSVLLTRRYRVVGECRWGEGRPMTR